ncbi:uncharacterized protein Dana_GF26597 [Drosophila ananassae]|uniref:Uncharacterized protein n=1 Tax=Drosophila ananassae TaxID=7217 RepID=A0A0P8XYN9_DROAN|nr:uncharacterized protein Dana_GF26597 [Drosophila ananassae]
MKGPPSAGPIIAEGLEDLGVCGTARSLSLNLKKSQTLFFCIFISRLLHHHHGVIPSSSVEYQLSN